jgi:uncharacterized membrane protein
MNGTISNTTSEKPFISESGLVLTVYILYLLGFCTGITALIGVIVAHVRASSASEVSRSHFRFQIRTFWIGMLYLIVGTLLTFVVIGALLLIWWLFWTLIRIIKGMLLLNDGKPISKPSSWMFG